MATLRTWAHSALDQLTDDVDRACYFSMTGGEGTVGLWTWHAASELGVHRLDVEAALGHDYSMTPHQALDAAVYTCDFFLPAMRRVLGEDPGGLSARLVDADEGDAVAVITSDGDSAVAIEGPGIDVLLALWGRPHANVSVSTGDAAVWDQWHSMPARAFQFGTWD